MAKLQERMSQAWPVFGRYGLPSKEYSALDIMEHDSGTIVRFFALVPGAAFDSMGAVKHGAHWHLSESRDGLDKFTNKQMQAYLLENELNWVVIV
jgi:hypothetical protein